LAESAIEKLKPHEEIFKIVIYPIKSICAFSDNIPLSKNNFAPVNLIALDDF